MHEVMKLGVLKDGFDYLFVNTPMQHVGIGQLSSMSMRTTLGIGRLRSWGFLHFTCDNVVTVYVCITVTGFTFQDNLNRTVHNYINSDVTFAAVVQLANCWYLYNKLGFFAGLTFMM